ncbi:MAG: YMGG-like glycine zipper-containing protein [Rubrivivax sp.]
MHLHTYRTGAGTAALALALPLLGGCVLAPARYGPYGPPPPAVVAQALPPMYFYPERDQTEAQQDRDRYECYRLAVRDSGVDPGMTPVTRAWTPPPPPARRDGAEVVGGAATGAILGAAVSRPRHAGENAVIGAMFGALLGAMSQESRAQAAEAAQAQRAAADARARVPLDNFRRAMGACMRSRSYTVG